MKKLVVCCALLSSTTLVACSEGGGEGAGAGNAPAAPSPTDGTTPPSTPPAMPGDTATMDGPLTGEVSMPAGGAGTGGDTTDPMTPATDDDSGDDGTGGPQPIDDGPADDTPPEPSPGQFPPVSDFSQPGPYTGTTIANVGPNNNYTVYMPMESPPEGAKNPLVAWTSGGGTTHVLYTLLPHLASHGFIVVTANTIPGIGAEAQLGDEIIAGLEWALSEDTRAGSMLEGRVDAERIASAGYSMGSLATFMIADDPRLTTTVHISGGNMVPERVNNLHAPAAFICGIPDPACGNLLAADCDIAGANCATDFDGAQTPVFYATFESGHLGILTSPFMERINAMTTAWLRRYLMDDTTIAGMFLGDDCEYCSDPNWTVQQKNF